ncbi:MAG: choice-of-anchor D domain-containing protein [Terriglobia bacterium]|jgi:uncharacterized repeat protein (TIGR03803 family)
MTRPSWWKTISCLCVFGVLGPIASRGQTFTTLYNFGAPGNGGGPSDQLVQGLDGAFYGTTFNGSTVFKITADGTLTTLYEFPCSQTGCPEGYEPYAGLVLATDGNFYGTTTYGGPNETGTVFKITPEGIVTLLYTFCSQTGCTDGKWPYAGLVQGTDGNFYGVTWMGGSTTLCNPTDGCGTVFKITPGGTLTTLYRFDGTHGVEPFGGLIQATDGNFYGTAYTGGEYNWGTVFRITADGTLTTLYSFCSEGPASCTDGLDPSAALVQGTDGNFYGTTYGGGAANGAGTVFRITQGGALTTLHTFDSTDGANPYAALVQGTDGNFYGTTLFGGNAGYGTIFQITPGGAFATLYSFCSAAGCADGAEPLAGMMQASNGTFYGTSSFDYAGTVFSLSMGLGPFVQTVPRSAGVGAAVIILGNGLANATGVSFNGTAATFTVVSDTEIETAVPTGATSGTVQVTTTNATLNSNLPFQVTAQQALAFASLAPTGLTFPAQNVGTTSASQTVILSDTGNAPLTLASIVASGNFSETNSCGTSVTPSSPCTINVTFSPTAGGTLNGTLTITDNSNGAPDSTQTVSLSGAGGAGAASLSPTSVGFGAQAINTTSSTRSVTLTNTGTAALSPVNISLSGANMGDFGETNNCPTSIAPGGKCTITLTFTPSLLAPESATLNVADNALNSPQTVALTGTGMAPVSFSAATLAFWNIGEDSASASQITKLINNQSVALRVTSLGMSNKDYTETDNCVGSVPARGSCTITVTLTPTVLGTDNGLLTVNDDAWGSPQTVTLAGTSILPVAFSAPTLVFGNVGEQSASAPQTLTLTNKQAVVLNISSIAMSNADYKETDNCVGNVAAKGTCTITVTLTPTVLTTDNGTLTVNDSALGGSQTVSLTGTGVLPVSLSVATLAFGNVAVKSASTPHSFTLTNQQAQALTISSIVPSPSDYKETDTCNGSVAAKGNCTITVTLTPGAVGADNGTLTIIDNASNSPQTVTLTGAGIAPVTFSAATLTFGSVGVSTPSPSQITKLINNQTVALNVTSLGMSNKDYTETDNCVGTVAAKGTCTITVTLTPSAIGTDNGTLSVNDDASGSPPSVTLTGAGIAPVTFSAATLAFWNIGENSASAAQTTKLINNQSVALSVASIGMSNPDYAETDNCVGTVPARGTCTITVTLTPTVLGTDNGMLTVNDNVATSPQSVTLNGTSILPAVLSAPSLGFGNVAQSTASSPKTLTLSNRENVALSIASIKTGNADFAESDTCNGSVAAKGSCAITITFTPSAIGAETGTLAVNDTASNTPQTAALTGTGLAQAALAPTLLTFGTQKSGTPSGQKVVTLTNNLATALTVAGISFGGANPGDFSETDNCVGNVAAKSSCTIRVTFTPGATGSRAGTLQVADSANNSPQTIPLTGTGD